MQGKEDQGRLLSKILSEFMRTLQGAYLTLVAQTRLYCADGRLPSLYLEAGDRVICARSGMVRLSGVQHITQPTDLVRISSRTNGDAVPQDSVVLTRQMWDQIAPDYPNLQIAYLGCVPVPLVTLHLPRSAVLLADGLKLPSQSDDGAQIAA